MIGLISDARDLRGRFIITAFGPPRESQRLDIKTITAPSAATIAIQCHVKTGQQATIHLLVLRSLAWILRQVNRKPGLQSGGGKGRTMFACPTWRCASAVNRISRLKSGNLRQAAFGLTAIRHMSSSMLHLQLLFPELFIAYLLRVLCTST